MALPASVLEKASNAPLAEDIVLKILRDHLPDVKATSLINQDDAPPFILVRQSPTMSDWGRDDPFVFQCYVEVQAIVAGPDADVDGALIMNAIDTVLKESALRKEAIYDDLGWMSSVSRVQEPRRRADWADSEGPVQYADLPAGYARFTSTFRLRIKKARKGPFVV